MRAFVEVLGCGPPDCSSSVQICFENGRYLFECGDGTQRLCTEYSIKLGRLRSICLTSLAAPSIGGLFGLLLTIADAGKQELTITAPTGIRNLLHAAREFCWRPNFKRVVQEVDIEAHPLQLPLMLIEDNNLTIEAVPIKARTDIEVDTGFGGHYDAVTYICRLKDIRGKFQPQKATELGVPKGKAFGVLQRGGSYKLEDGTVITSDQVMTEGTHGPIVVIVACPSVDHITNLTTTRALNPVQLGVLRDECGKELMRTTVLCHLAPREVIEASAYREWCNSFGESVSHIPLHSSMSAPKTIYRAQAEVILKLHHTLDQNIFPLPSELHEPKATNNWKDLLTASGEVDDKTSHISSSRLIPLLQSEMTGKWLESDCRLKFMLSPVAKVGPDASDVRPRFLDVNQDLERHQWQNVPSPEEKESVEGTNVDGIPDCVSLRQRGDTAVRFFGTGAAIPGNRRNVSAIMIDRFQIGSILLDCGEGTWGQMVRQFGLKRAQETVCRMTVLFISHMHADHHLGLLTLLHARTVAFRSENNADEVPQLTIIGPAHLYRWLEAFEGSTMLPLRDTIKPKRRSFRFCDADALVDPQRVEEVQYFTDSHHLEIGCVEVDHCPFSYGIIIHDLQKKWKVVYSGDTLPCEQLADAGKGATLAIHEATLDDDMREEAEEKKHSTTGQALNICANKMGAWRTILTHFSQRYPKIPLLNEAVVANLSHSRAAVAFDLMCVDFSRLEELPRIVPNLQQLFPDESIEEIAEASMAETLMET